MKKRPCESHSIAIPDLVTPEMVGMMLNDKKFTMCHECGWFVEIPVVSLRKDK